MCGLRLICELVFSTIYVADPCPVHVQSNSRQALQWEYILAVPVQFVSLLRLKPNQHPLLNYKSRTRPAPDRRTVRSTS